MYNLYCVTLNVEYLALVQLEYAPHHGVESFPIEHKVLFTAKNELIVKEKIEEVWGGFLEDLTRFRYHTVDDLYKNWGVHGWFTQFYDNQLTWPINENGISHSLTVDDMLEHGLEYPYPKRFFDNVLELFTVEKITRVEDKLNDVVLSPCKTRHTGQFTFSTKLIGGIGWWKPIKEKIAEKGAEHNKIVCNPNQEEKIELPF